MFVSMASASSDKAAEFFSILISPTRKTRSRRSRARINAVITIPTVRGITEPICSCTRTIEGGVSGGGSTSCVKRSFGASKSAGSSRARACPGFADHKNELSAAEYAERIAAGELYDATLSFQIQNGFEVRGVLENYIRDEATDGWSALIVWRNPEHSS